MDNSNRYNSYFGLVLKIKTLLHLFQMMEGNCMFTGPELIMMEYLFPKQIKMTNGPLHQTE